MIQDAVRWEDQTVNAFDEQTNELRGYAGTYREMCYKIIQGASPTTKFWHGVKRRIIKEVKREEW